MRQEYHLILDAVHNYVLCTTYVLTVPSTSTGHHQVQYSSNLIAISAVTDDTISCDDHLHLYHPQQYHQSV